MNMIKREIKKRYINTLHPRFSRYSYKKYEEQWSIDELIDNKFDKNGKLISCFTESKLPASRGDVTSLPSPRGLNTTTTTYKYDSHGNIIEENWGSSLRSSIAKYENKYDQNGNLIGYDCIYKKFDNPYIQNDDALEEEIFSTTEFELKHNEHNLLTESRRVGINNNGFISYEELLTISYDESEEIIKKNKKSINKSEDGEDYYYTEERNRFYYDDKGQKVEEVNCFYTKEEGGELILDYKHINKHEETVTYRKNKFDNKLLYYYDENGLKIKEEQYFGDSDKIYFLTEIEYEYHEN